jgi:hypothetical protein
MNLFKRFAVTSAVASTLALGAAAPAHADPPPVNIGQGLVNVQIAGTTVDVDVPISVAANICDVNAAVLVGQFRDTGDAECDATATSLASPGTHTHQGGVNVGQGLVNVQLAGTTIDIAVPVSVAANLCDINAAVLVGQFHDAGAATCEATADSLAS